jgi:magnesium chelatase family protein
LDLPIAVGILAAMGEIDSALLTNYVFVGELSLEGLLRPIPGILTMAVGLRRIRGEFSEQGSVRQDLLINENTILVIPRQSCRSQAGTRLA